MLHVDSYDGKNAHEIVNEMGKNLRGKKIHIENITMAYNPKTTSMEAIIVYGD